MPTTFARGLLLRSMQPEHMQIKFAADVSSSIRLTGPHPALLCEASQMCKANQILGIYIRHVWELSTGLLRCHVTEPVMVYPS